MKKAIAVIAALVLIGGAFFAGLSVGTYRPGYYLEESKVYSKEDIEKCARLARKRKAYAVRISYSDKWLDYAESFLGQIEGVDSPDNILVIKADYLTGNNPQAQEPNTLIRDWSFVFYRTDSDSQWKLYSEGYA